MKRPKFVIGDDLFMRYGSSWLEVSVTDIVNFPPRAGTHWFYRLIMRGTGVGFQCGDDVEGQLRHANPLMRLVAET